jgi:hypothetical protein
MRLAGRKLVDVLVLMLSLGLVLGITVLTVQSHASHEQLAKASVKAAVGR